MAGVWIAGALLLGLAAWRVGLPPLVGFLASGFAFGALGMEPSAMLAELAHAGVLLLLFAVGLKLRVKTLLRTQVWGTALLHLVVTGAAGAVALRWTANLSWASSWLIAVMLGFSSTVLAAKVLEGNRELRSVHGRVAIGILIVQDIVAVALLALVAGETPSPFALALLLLPLARPVLAWLLDFCGHGELLVLFGALLAIGGGEGFAHLGLSPELGALVLGVLLADHRRAQELTNVLWGLKELFLVGFFLNIGIGAPPSWAALRDGAGLLVMLPFQGVIFFLLLVASGLRARTSFLTAISLTTYSEFALIVADLAVRRGLLEPSWLVVTAFAVALSFVLAAPLNAFAHEIYTALGPWLERFERDKRHPDDEPISLGSAEILVVGMGRVGSGAYDYLREQDENIVGVDSDPGKIESNIKEGRRVAYADAEDPSFWLRLNLERLRAIMLAVPDIEAKLTAARALRRRGFKGLIAATHLYPEEYAPILAAGCNVSYNYYTEAGVGFARHTYEALTANADSTSAAEYE
ncbi:MAG TPA: cation:proton antiporter family protein [Gammaproteobacteria bacterium]|nr:cation:proton antiporter family protein [Gammaproteobacteria bacterium]